MFVRIAGVSRTKSPAANYTDYTRKTLLGGERTAAPIQETLLS